MRTMRRTRRPTWRGNSRLAGLSARLAFWSVSSCVNASASLSASGSVSLVPLVLSTSRITGKLLVPAGSVVLMHHDLVHRATRRHDAAAPFRAMIAIRNVVRISDPLAEPGEPQSLTPAGPHETMVQRSLRYYMAGRPAPPVSLPQEKREQLAALCWQSEAEAERMEAAHTLAADPAALGLLFDLLLRVALECGLRAAACGLATAGSAAIPRLLRVLSGGEVVATPSDQPHIDRAAHVRWKCRLPHRLPPPPPPPPPPPSSARAHFCCSLIGVECVRVCACTSGPCASCPCARAGGGH